MRARARFSHSITVRPLRRRRAVLSPWMWGRWGSSVTYTRGVPNPVPAALRAGRSHRLIASVDWSAWVPRWSKVSAMRALRATLVVPGLFAFTDKVIGNLQMATFAAFGGFATL